jgi:PIN domain nuclease of toxin-antitoxin system
VRRELAKVQNELWLSPVSTWEVLQLHFRGRIQIHGDLAAWLAQATTPLREAPLTHKIVLAAYELAFAHADPAERFLPATAEVLDLTLVIADARLLGLGEIKTLANR